jgi:small-conductance mechanosensitive channel
MRWAISGIILFISFIIGRILSNLYRKTVKSPAEKVIKKFGLDIKLENVIKYAVYVVGFLLALYTTGFLFLFGAIIASLIGIVIIAIFIFKSKDFIMDLYAGFLLRKQDFKVGDKIRIAGVKGEIIRKSLLEVQVEKEKGDLLIVPNNYLKNNLKDIKFK